MKVVLYVVFMVTSVLILMQIFRFSTYHKYFLLAIPVLAGYGILVGYILFVFNYPHFFLWYIFLLIFFFSIILRKDQQQAKIILSLKESDDQKKFLNKSITKTTKYYMFSSIIYIFSVFISFVYFFNV